LVVGLVDFVGGVDSKDKEMDMDMDKGMEWNDGCFRKYGVLPRHMGAWKMGLRDLR
jgi:hypothetical protein